MAQDHECLRLRCTHDLLLRLPGGATLDPFAWDGLFVLVNMVHIVILIREKTGVSLTAEERLLLRTVFKGMAPQKFMGLARARRRGHRNVLDQCPITAAVQNMKRIISAMEYKRPTHRDAQGARIPTSLLNLRLFRALYRWLIASFTFRDQYAW